MNKQTHTRAPGDPVRRHLARVAGIVAAMSVSCRDAPPPPPAPSGPTLVLAIDGAERTIAIDRTIPLTSLVAPAPRAWLEVRAEATDGRWLELPSPASTYPGAELRLSVERGRVAIGVFGSAPAPLASLVPVVRVDVMTRAPALPALTITLAGDDLVVDGARLRELRTISDGPHLQGWPLGDLLALVAGAHPPAAVRIIGDVEVTLDAEALAAPHRRHVLKANQRGEYVFRVWAEGDRRPTREVRRVTKIVVD